MKTKIIMMLLFLLPLLLGAKTIIVNENDLIKINPSALDPDQDPLTYLFTDPLNASGEWQTGPGDKGIYNVSVLVTDGGYVIENILIVVNGSNEPPFMEIIPNITVKEGSQFKIPVFAKDPDGDNLDITYTGWINKGTYTTTYDDAGIHTVTVTVSDGEFSIWQDVIINVTQTNRPPVILGPDQITANEGETIVIVPNAIDPDGDTIKYTYEGWMTTNSYTLGYDDSGNHQVTIFASDGGNLKSTKKIEIIVNDVNRPPVFVNLTDITLNEGTTLIIDPIFYDDDDDDELTLTISGFTTQSETYLSYDSAGEYIVNLMLSDGINSISEDIKITVVNVNRAPIIKNQELHLMENEEYTIIPNASDPDGDELYFTFSGFSNTSTFNTDFYDAGTHELEIIASDGNKQTYATYTLVVENVNQPPTIEVDSDYYLIENDLLIISPNIYDPDGDSWEYILSGWKNYTGTGDFSYLTNFEDSGDHVLTLVATDGNDYSSKEINIHIENLNRPPRAYYTEVIVNESDIIEIIINTTDPDGDELTIEYISLFDENGIWKTDYEDAGVYFTNFTVSDGQYVSKNRIKVTILDVDRAPLFKEINDISTQETKTISIELFANDEDGDNITFSVENPPEGSILSDGFFTWTPDYGFVDSYNGWWHKMLKFFSLYEDKKEVNIQFKATGKEKSSFQDVTITVVNQNRPPTLNYVSDIYIKEGDLLEFYPDAYDLDGENIKFKYSGWINTNIYQTTYEDSGEHYIDVIASDGKKETSQRIRVFVENVNRDPVYDEIPIQYVNEGQELRVKLGVSDLDGDKIELYADNLPSWAYLLDDELVYPVPYDAVKNTEKLKEITVYITAKDSESEIQVKVPITITHMNQPPTFTSTEPQINNIKVFQGGVLDFKVQASDPDGDNLTYKWDFGLLNSLNNGNRHSRRYINIGSKTVKAIVSDGYAEIEKVWNIEVLPAKQAIKKITKTTSPTTNPTPTTISSKDVNYQQISQRYVITHVGGDNLETNKEPDVYVV